MFSFKKMSAVEENDPSPKAQKIMSSQKKGTSC